MPCSDNYDDRDGRIDHLARLLCLQCKHNERNNYSINSEVQVWWTEHKNNDIKQIERLKSYVEDCEVLLQSYIDIMKRYQNSSDYGKFVLYENKAKAVIEELERYKKEIEELEKDLII